MPAFFFLTAIVIVVFVLILAAVFYVVGQAAWALACVCIIRGIRPEGQRAKLITLTVPLFIPVYLLLLASLAWITWPDKEDAYWSAFGMSPGPTVTVHQGYVDGFGDYLSIELHFTASPADIQTIVAQGLTLDPNYDATTAFNNSILFSPIPMTGKDIYIGESAHQQYYTEDAVLVVDPVTNEAWYFFIGVD